ncbi:MAG: PIG-L family deacetylase [Treponema sp.]|jgi:LmbE family N-acetylglucosaminyl deacetylase|nr:PIG-L family deacetylase [Treponema sp.]
MVVLAVGAHPDDLELHCFGTLAKFVKNGHTVYTSTIANGNKGHYQIKPRELAETRLKETSDAAKLIGATYIGLDVADMMVDSHDRDQQKKAVELIRKVKPDLIITHGSGDYMSDHTETAGLIFYAAFASSLPSYPAELPFHDDVVPVYNMENASGIGFVPDEYVDISEEFELKLDAIRCHKSQMEWLSEHDGFNMLDSARIFAEFRGMQCSVKYAEAFALFKKWPRLRSQRLLP